MPGPSSSENDINLRLSSSPSPPREPAPKKSRIGKFVPDTPASQLVKKPVAKKSQVKVTSSYTRRSTQVVPDSLDTSTQMVTETQLTEVVQQTPDSEMVCCF